MHDLSLVEQLEYLDSQLISEGVPLRFRPLDCFKRLYGSVHDRRRREELFDPINDWYLQKYGDSARWDGVIARFPILVKGVVYLTPARFVADGEVLTNIEEEIEDLPNGVIRSLPHEELRTISEKITVATRGFHSLYNLSVDDSWLGATERDLVKRASYDLENAAMALRHTGDTQTAIVQAHEAAEKMLKASLARSGSDVNLKAFRHNIPKAFKELVRRQPRYRCLSLPVENLQRLSPNMEMRYAVVPRSAEMAVEAYHGSLFVCGMVAQMWLFDRLRGTTKSSFKECSFYVDGTNTFYCKRVRANLAELTLFASSELMGTQMADLTVDISESALYLEVKDQVEDAQLRLQLGAILRNPGRRVAPEEMGVRRVHGPEGSYTTAILKIPASKPEA